MTYFRAYSIFWQFEVQREVCLRTSRRQARLRNNEQNLRAGQLSSLFAAQPVLDRVRKFVAFAPLKIQVCVGFVVTDERLLLRIPFQAAS